MRLLLKSLFPQILWDEPNEGDGGDNPSKQEVIEEWRGIVEKLTERLTAAELALTTLSTAAEAKSKSQEPSQKEKDLQSQVETLTAQISEMTTKIEAAEAIKPKPQTRKPAPKSSGDADDRKEPELKPGLVHREPRRKLERL